MQNACLRCRNVGKRFGERWVFRGLDLEVLQGQVLVVAGANGSGKSTLLRLIAGLTPSTEGEIALEMAGGSLPASFVSKRLGWSATDGALYGAMSALEHLRWWAMLHDDNVSDQQLLAHLRHYELDNRTGDWVKTFSTGMKQRLRLAIATLCEPVLLLLDEPGAGMDTQGRELLKRVIDEQRTRGITLLATNQPDEYALGTLMLRMGA
jgi:heme exporter protein A